MNGSNLILTSNLKSQLIQVTVQEPASLFVGTLFGLTFTWLFNGSFCIVFVAL